MIEILVDDSAFRACLKRLEEAAENLQPVMEDIGGDLEAAVRARFLTRSDPNGQPWKAWQPRTKTSYPYPGTVAAKKAGKAGSGRLLDRFGDMLESLNYDATGDSVRVGFGQHYAVFHEFGTKKMARRGMLLGDPGAGKLGADDEQAVMGILQARLDRASKG